MGLRRGMLRWEGVLLLYEGVSDHTDEKWQTKIWRRCRLANGFNCLVVGICAKAWYCWWFLVQRCMDGCYTSTWTTGFRTGQGCHRHLWLCVPALRVDKIRGKGWWFTLCIMGGCARKGVVCRTTCALATLERLFGVSGVVWESCCTLVFRTLALPLMVSLKSALGCSRNNLAYAGQYYGWCRVRVARHKGFPC